MVDLDDEDEIDFDEWIEMSDAERDRIVDSAERQFHELYESWTPRQQFAWRRRMTLQNCLHTRRMIKANFVPELQAQWLRERQMRLVHLRAERHSGYHLGGVQ